LAKFWEQEIDRF